MTPLVADNDVLSTRESTRRHETTIRADQCCMKSNRTQHLLLELGSSQRFNNVALMPRRAHREDNLSIQGTSVGKSNISIDLPVQC